MVETDLEMLYIAVVALISATTAIGVALLLSRRVSRADAIIQQLRNELAHHSVGQKSEQDAPASPDLNPQIAFPGLIFFWIEPKRTPVVLGRPEALGMETAILKNGDAGFQALLATLDDRARKVLESAIDLVWDRKSPVSGVLDRPQQNSLGYSVFDFNGGVYLVLAPGTQIGSAITRERAIVRKLPFPLWKTDHSGHILWANEAYTTSVDAEAPTRVIVEQRHLIEDISPAMMARMTTEDDDVWKLRAVRRGHGIINGQRRAFEITSYWTDEEVVHVAVDRTEEEQLLKDLDIQDGAHRQLLNEFTTAVVVTGRDHNLIYYNEAYLRLWGLSENFLATQPSHTEIMDELRRLRKIPEKADYKGWLAEQFKLYTSPERSREELWHLPDNKTLRVVSAQHPLGGLLTLYEDVTDQLALERSYNTLIRVQRATLDNLYEGVAVFGTDGRLQLYNAAYERMYGIDPGSLKSGLTFDDIVALVPEEKGLDTDWEELKSYIIRSKAQDRPKTGRMIRSDDLVVDYAAVPLPDGATLLTHLDVSDTHRMQMALQQRNDALEAADRLKSEFLTHVSYQLRTPLSSILGFSEMLIQNYLGPLTEKQGEYVDAILTSSHQLSSLIDNIIDLTAIQEGELELDIKVVRVADLIQSLIDLHKPRAQEKGLRFSCTLSADLGEVEVDEIRLKQIMANLLSNAFKYTYPGDSVTVTGRGFENEIMIQVEDTGMGIPAEYQGNIFDQFEALDRDSRKRGAGLGLSMVRSFVDLHGGRIELDSELDRGTRFAFYLPRKAVVPGNAGEDVVELRSVS